MSCPEVVKLFSCSTPLIMKFQLLIESKMLTIFYAHNTENDVFNLLINIKIYEQNRFYALFS